MAAIVGLISIAALTPVPAQDTQKQGSSPEPQTSESLRTFVPDTVSEGWRSVSEAFPDPTQAPTMPGHTDIEGWKKAHSEMEKTLLESAEQAVKQFGVSVAGKDFGGVPLLEVTPKGWKDDGKVLLYAHGGAYTMLAARSTLPSSAMVAAHTGLRVISVDYTNPPRAWCQLCQTYQIGTGRRRIASSERAVGLNPSSFSAHCW